MSNFRTKFLGLAAVATAFAGLSYGQVISGCVTSPAPAGVGGPIEPSNPSLRAEGETELVQDVRITCSNTAATSGTLVISVSPLVITSKTIPVLGAAPTNEATLIINGTGASIAGVVSGSNVTFSIGAGLIPLAAAPATFTFDVYNIRVNATGATSPQVSETGVISYAAAAGTSNIGINAGAANAATPVGFVLPSLGATSITALSAQAYTGCAGNPITVSSASPTVAPKASFQLAIAELAPGGFFKGPGTANAAGVGPGEGGYLTAATAAPATGVNAATGTATTATQIQVTVGNLPTGSTVYVPATVAVTAGGTTTLTASGTAVGGTGTLATYVPVTPVSGVATVLYTVSVAGGGAAGAQTFNVPVNISFPANTAAQAPITALVTYSPTGTLTGPATSVPTFAASTATAIPTATIANCSTTLLFPYVTNASGFETGIAVSNTTTDNLKIFPVPGSAATPTTGTCTLNFYGNAAQPTATVTPTLGAYTTAAPTVVPVYANTLTAMVGSSGFTGYAIASCNFLDGHGFAFITDASGTFSGAMGYLATVVPSSRNENGTDAITLTVTPGGGAASIGVATSLSASGTLTPSVGQ